MTKDNVLNGNLFVKIVVNYLEYYGKSSKCAG